MTHGRVVLLGGAKASTNIIYHALATRLRIEQVIMESRVSNQSLLARRVRKLGPRKVMGQMCFKLIAEPAIKRSARGRIEEITRAAKFDASPIDPARVVRVASVNAPETISVLQALAPKVVIISGTRIIAREVLESVPASFINMHAGMTPMYRGVHGGYWALAAGDRAHCGVTVHLVDAGIDTGRILAQQSIEPTAEDSFATYPLLQLAAGLPHLIDVTERAIDGRLPSFPDPVGPSRLYSHPTLREYLSNWLRQGVR